MGCDIHLFTEYKTKRGKLWHPGDAWVKDTRDSYEEPKKREWRVPYQFRAFHDRDYNFFAFLANVRNATWGDPLPYLTDDRGLPSDVTARVKAVSDQYGSDGHSHSYLTLAELEAGWDKYGETKIRFEAYLHNPDPAWVALPEMERPAPSSYAAWSNVGDKYVWYQPLSDLIKTSYWKLQDFLLWLNIDKRCGGSDNVRAVFWFDN